MSAPYNPNIDLQVGRGHGLHLEINRRPVPDSYGAIVMADSLTCATSPPFGSKCATPAPGGRNRRPWPG